MKKENKIFDWIEAYTVIKKIFCDKCNKECNKDKKLLCIEQFLYIVGNWELAFYERQKNEKNNN